MAKIFSQSIASSDRISTRVVAVGLILYPFGTNTSCTVPKALWGGEQFYPSGQQEEDGWIYGTVALPKGRRALRIHGTDRVVIIGGPPGRATTKTMK